MNEELARLSAAIEKKTQAELERKDIEEERVRLEMSRLEIISTNEALLNSIADAVQSLAELMSDIGPEMVSQSKRIDIIFEFMRIIVGWLSTQGYREADRLDALLTHMGQSEMKVEINADRDVNTGDIIEGNKTSINGVVVDIAKALEKGDIAGAEQIFDSLPQDAVDVALAALAGPLNAAMVIVKKIGGKMKFMKVRVDD